MIIIIIFILVIVFTIPTVYAVDDSFTLNDPYLKIVITPEQLIIGEPVTISCKLLNDEIQFFVILRVFLNYQTVYEGSESVTMTFDTSDMIGVDCVTVFVGTAIPYIIQSHLHFTPIELSSTYPSDNIKKSGRGGCSDCIPPTLGYDSKGVKKVDNGICINGSCMDGGYFHTEYTMQSTLLYWPNTISLKYYENNGPSNMQMVQLGIGVKEIGSPLSQSQAIIEVWLNPFKGDMYNPTIQEIIIVDPDKMLYYTDADISLVPCMDSFSSSCLQVDFKYSYAKPPASPILVTNAWDIPRNAINNYINNGLSVINYTPEILKE